MVSDLWAASDPTFVIKALSILKVTAVSRDPSLVILDSPRGSSDLPRGSSDLPRGSSDLSICHASAAALRGPAELWNGLRVQLAEMLFVTRLLLNSVSGLLVVDPFGFCSPDALQGLTRPTATTMRCMRAARRGAMRALKHRRACFGASTVISPRSHLLPRTNLFMVCRL